MSDVLIQTLIFLSAAVIAVPLSKRLGLGSVLGYLIAGIVIGPTLGLVGEEAEHIQHIAEIGVVMMLFLVGLELKPMKLWGLRYTLLGLGGLQVVLTTVAIFAIAKAFQLQTEMALAVGLVLSLSSTAIILQTLSEKGLIKTHGGQSTFSVLLFQDIAVIPMLSILPLLALPELMGQVDHTQHSNNLLNEFPAWGKALATIAVVSFIVLASQYFSRPVFRYLAKTNLREMFTAFALLLVIGVSVLMTLIGLSPALGSFLAGVVLANNEYRHELESNIEPFKGLLLGLFFITVGAGVNFDILGNAFVQIMSLTLGLIAVKVCILLFLGKLFNLKGADQWLFSLGLAQAGEFGFVLLSFCTSNAILPTDIADKLLLIIALSMLLTPLLFIIFDAFISPRMSATSQRDDDVIDEHDGSIIIAGHGRFGQMVNRLLLACDHHPTVIDLDVHAIEQFSKVGFKTYFGDASRSELLEAAGIENCKLLVIAIDNRQRALNMVSNIRQQYPNLNIVARAFDKRHAFELYEAGATEIIRETFDSSIRAAKSSLELLGMDETLSQRVTEFYFDKDRQDAYELAQLYDSSLPRFGNKPMIVKTMALQAETRAQVKHMIQAYRANED
ncbi:MAG: monovalent cation:proton antiporter-2 (CPA2) family protein [Pseudomonadota bacterium]